MIDFACCAGAGWSPIADLGSAVSFDFILGRCTCCGRTWMNVWSPVAPQPRYLPIAAEDAERLSATPEGAARKRALADWFEAG